MRTLPLWVLGTLLAAGAACGEEEAPARSPGEETLAEETLFWRWQCGCLERQSEPAVESSACVRSNLSPAQRECEIPIIDANWDKIRVAGTCRYEAWRAGISCFEDSSATCTAATEGNLAPPNVEFCVMSLNNDLQDCGAFDAEVQTELDACG